MIIQIRIHTDKSEDKQRAIQEEFSGIKINLQNVVPLLDFFMGKHFLNLFEFNQRLIRWDTKNRDVGFDMREIGLV